jgi:aminoglycoside 6'-N-acetyltransferase I
VAEVRRLGGADLSAWLSLRVLLYQDETASVLEDEMRAVLSDPDQAAFGVFEGETMVGFVEVARRDWGEGCETQPVAWIEGILVLSDMRRHGLGGELVESAAQWARDKGFRELGSDAEANNLASIASHGAWGFEETQRLVIFRREL